MIARIRRYWPFLGALFLLASITALTAATYTFDVRGTATSSGGTIQCDVGQPYVGSTPPAAVKAGFTHCAYNLDFTSAAMANPATWLTSDDGECTASVATLAYVEHGSGTPCARYQIVDDSAHGAPQVLKISFLTTDTFNATSFISASGFNFPTPAGFWSFYGFYAEETSRLEATSQVASPCQQGGTGQNGCIYFDWWSYPMNGNAEAEFDFVEQYGVVNNGGGGGGGGAGLFPGALYGSINNNIADPSAGYNNYGALATISNSTGSAIGCNAGGGSGCNVSGCGVTNNANNNACLATFISDIAQQHIRFITEVGPQTQSFGPVGKDEIAYIKRTTIWTCDPNFKTGPCYTGLVDY